MALYGGRWAVAASDFIQALLILAVTSATAVLTVLQVGGFGALLEQIPKGHLNPFIPLASGVRYDWLYVASGVLPIIYFRNNVLNANRYISAKDGREARKAAFIPLIGYLIFPFVWLIPAFGAHALVPDLLNKYSMFDHPAEAAYIGVAIQLLPAGLLGLLIAGLFATTMSSMDTALVANSALFVKNFYQPILRPGASDPELLRVGQILTGIFGLLIMASAIFLVSGFSISLFDIYQVLLGYIGGPLGIPLFLGMFIRKTPPWSGWATVLFGVFVGIFIFNLYDLQEVRNLLVPMMGEETFSYWSEHKFTMTNLVNIPLTSLFFVLTGFFYRRPDPNNPAAVEVDRFFTNMHNPVDFEKEVGSDNSAQQARLIGRLALAYAAFIALLLLIPNPAQGRLAILGCSLFVGGIGTALLIYGARRARLDRDQSVAQVAE
jgi:Na+/proline symporter